MFKYLRIIVGLFILVILRGGIQLSDLNITEIDSSDKSIPHLIPNPAAYYCKSLGYTYEIVDTDQGQQGICRFQDGSSCNDWEFLQGKCGQDKNYCANQGYMTQTATDGKNSFSQEYAVCVAKDGQQIGSVTDLLNFQTDLQSPGCSTAENPATEFPNSVKPSYSPPSAPTVDLPASFDWHNNLGSDWMTPVKNQGGCGSCWAFSAVGAAEASHNIGYDNPNLDLDLAEEYLVSDCSSSGSCCGGWHDEALNFIKNNGIPDEGCMSYVDGGSCGCSDGSCDSNCTYNSGGKCSDRTCSDRCSDWSSRLVTIDSVTYISSNPTTLKQALVEKGPLAVALAMGGYWDGNIFRCTNDAAVNHAVVVTGYDDVGGYWIVKNSWGSTWNGNGYFFVGYNECSIENYAYLALENYLGDSYEPDNSAEEAKWIDSGSTQTHSISPIGDVDWVKFSLSGQSAVLLETSGTSGDTRMWLYDSNLNELDYDDDGGVDYFSRIDRTCGVDSLNAGTYYIKVNEKYSANEIPSYNLSFDITELCQQPPDPPSNLQQTGATTSTVTISWQDNSDNENGFNIYRWTGYEFEYLDSVSANETSFTDTSIPCDYVNYYDVSAYNDNGESSWAGWIEAKTSACPTVENDGINNAKVIYPPLPYQDTLDTTGATSAQDDPPLSRCNRGAGLATVWYRYTPTNKVSIEVNTIGSDYDTMLAIWTGSPGNLALWACNDDTGSLQSGIIATLSAGTSYYIEVAQYNSSLTTGESDINLKTNNPEGINSGGTLKFNIKVSNRIFKDDFETDDLSRWTSCNTDNSLYVIEDAAIHGYYGMLASIDDNNSIYCTDDNPKAEKNYHARFYFHPKSIPMANGDSHQIFAGYSGTFTKVVVIEFRKSPYGRYQLRTGTLLDSLTWNYTPWFAIYGYRAYPIEIYLKAATSPGSNNGSLTLWIDGLQKAVLTNLDNDTRKVDRIRLGAVAGVDTGTRGSYYFDDFASTRFVYIGP